MINPSHLLTIPHPLERIVPILTLNEEIFKEVKCYVPDVTTQMGRIFFQRYSWKYFRHRTGNSSYIICSEKYPVY